MSRLIDADKLKVAVYHSFAPYQYEWARTISDISNVIDNQPTAYDVEAVVKELQEANKELCHIMHCKHRSCSICVVNNFLAMQIEIVTKGGVKNE